MLTTIRAGVRQLREMAERTPPNRNRHVDLLRAVAILMVVVGHWLAMAVFYTEAHGFTGQNVLGRLDWAHPLTAGRGSRSSRGPGRHWWSSGSPPSSSA